MIREIRIEGYRSLRAASMAMGRLSVVTGENGVGKTNLYRGLELLRAAAVGDLARRLAQEGGMASALWAGATPLDPQAPPEAPKARRDARLKLGVRLESLEYEIVLGLPGPTDPALALDPVVKEERVSIHVDGRRAVMLERKGPHISAREPDGAWRSYKGALLMAETALATLRDPHQFPELHILQKRLTDWRFYHGFRSDADSPLRQPQPAVCAPTLDSDGVNLAAALATAIHLKEGPQGVERSEVGRAVEEAFPGSRLEFVEAAGRYLVAMRTPGFPRSFSAPELSDGVLRYLALVGALCAYRRPDFIALNEPEASLHPALIAPLGRLILRASAEAQILVVSHSDALARLLEQEGGARVLRLEKLRGETRLPDSAF
ncbi:AAA family ATPase [Neomegalonema perideroedes]|uniref:AAA family ATPase n=1 Tax=Neomegalonema perideroedes TaxID=217219 RepID=UPI00037CBCA3|nr:AAA family ATPase [Neomegalonema perideroedes]